MAIEAVIFDVGNVLIEERWDLVERELIKVTQDVSLSQFKDAVKGKHWKDYSEGRMQQGEYWNLIAEEIGLDQSYSNKLSSVFSKVWTTDDYTALDNLKPEKELISYQIPRQRTRKFSKKWSHLWIKSIIRTETESLNPTWMRF